MTNHDLNDQGQAFNMKSQNMRQGAGGHVRSYGMGKGVASSAAPARQAPSDLYQTGTHQANQAGIHQAEHKESAQVMPSQAQQVTQQEVYGQESQKRKKSRGFWIAIVIAIICILLAAALALSMLGGKSNRQGDLGQLDGKTDAEIQAELDRVVEDGMFNISIASVVQFDSGTAPGELRIENVPGNRYLMSVQITHDDTGEVIYTTDMIEPNHHIQSDELAVALPKGNYDCTATFFAYDPETEELIGQAAAKMKIIVAS